MPPHHLTNIEMQKYYQSEPKFKKYLRKITDGTYVINLDEYKSVGTHWTASYVNANNIVYFDSFKVEHIPNEIKKFIGNENIIAIYHINLFSPNDYEKNDKIILKYLV